MSWEKAKTVKVESVLILEDDGITRNEHAVVTLNEDYFFPRKVGIDKQTFDRIKKVMNWK